MAHFIEIQQHRICIGAGYRTAFHYRWERGYYSVIATFQKEFKAWIEISRVFHRVEIIHFLRTGTHVGYGWHVGRICISYPLVLG